jgi:hypothetical protein
MKVCNKFQNTIHIGFKEYDECVLFGFGKFLHYGEKKKNWEFFRILKKFKSCYKFGKKSHQTFETIGKKERKENWTCIQ